MRKGIIQKLTMLAFVAMVGIPAFAQGGKFGTNAGVATTIGEGHVPGDVFDLEELQYYVIDTESGLNLKVIGFASYISGATGDPTLLESKYAGTVTIPHYLYPADVGVAAHVSSVAANAFTTTVLYPTAPGNSADSKDQFATAAAKVTNLVIDYSSTEITAEFGANAFAGLTALTEVKNLTPGDKVLDIPENAFANTTYGNATLIVPDGSQTMGLYAQHTGWCYFLLIKSPSMTGYFLDINGDGDIDEYDLLALEDACLLDDFTGLSSETLDVNGDGFVDEFDMLALEDLLLLR